MKRIGLLVAVVMLAGGFVCSLSARAQSKNVAQIAPLGHEKGQNLASVLNQGPATGSGYLGVFLADLSETRAKELKLAEARGAVVGKVKEGSPAEKAGLRENDVILSYNGQRVESKTALNRLLTKTLPGRSVTLGVSRDGKPQNIQVTLGERPPGFSFGLSDNVPTDVDLMRQQADEFSKQSEEMRRQSDEKKAQEFAQQSEALRQRADEVAAEMEQLRREGKLQSSDGGRFFRPPAATRYYLGVTTLPLSEQLAKFFNLKGGAGLLVTEVEPKSAAERAGLKAGDCIAAVNGERVNSSADLARLVSRPGKDEPEAAESSLTIVRDRSEQTIKVKPERR